ncbi:MAG TPA: basic secretory protein-like protein, partial [Isosphaeraceae bacterium]|nr:basic secretory protein-like protein [Isosphaeraceae bacterium]
GRPDGSDRLTAATIEVSTDGKAFDQPRPLADGQTLGNSSKSRLKAVRLRPAADLKHPLVLREVTIKSSPQVAVFQYPVEFVVDVADAPEMKEWADKTARICERAYPMINHELKSDGFKPASLIKMSLKNSYRGVAAAGGGHITGSVKYFKDHPADVGAMVHETVHIVQRYHGRGNPSWLVEGVADYVRFFKFEPGNLGPINPERAHYNQSYRVTAAFLAYLAEKYDPKIVLKLNQIMREGTYKPDVFERLTGKKVEDLDSEWRGTLKKPERAARK